VAKEIFLTEVAESNYEAITDYIFEKFGPIITNNFIERFWEVCLLISETPEIYPLANKAKQIRKCVVSKHNTIYFKEYNDVIRILVVFDNRQDPEKLGRFI